MIFLHWFLHRYKNFITSKKQLIVIAHLMLNLFSICKGPTSHLWESYLLVWLSGWKQVSPEWNPYQLQSTLNCRLKWVQNVRFAYNNKMQKHCYGTAVMPHVPPISIHLMVATHSVPNNIINNTRGFLRLPSLSNWNLSLTAALWSDGSAYASGITTLESGFKSESQSSSSAGFWSNNRITH